VKQINPVNRKRRAKAFERAFHSEGRVLWVKSLPCITCSREYGIHNSHVISRKAGGDYTTIVPQCFECHGNLGSHGFSYFCTEELPTPETVKEWLLERAKAIQGQWIELKKSRP
jgi:hypothetical protein